MEHTGADDHVEGLAHGPRIEQVALEQFQIIQTVPLLEKALVRERGFGQIEGDDLVLRIHVGRISGLYGSAARDEDSKVPARATARPEHRPVKRRIAYLMVALANLFREVRAGRGIGEHLV